jgi:mono/diheme cytochrome c family protein
MNYPVWYLPHTGGGLLIALIAILHVFVSHFAVGAGLYLVAAEKKGLRENNPGILDFTRRHARFFMLVTMVFGAITGVGIWFIISLVNPAATSLLIHSFVFAWAAEWVFFTVEIAAAFVYYYTFGKMRSRDHLKVAWLYAFSAWMSLFLINGIIGMMLTPGQWVESRDFWQGFFNPSFWPSLVFRSGVAVMIAACYGYLSAAFTNDQLIRTAMTRFSATWALVGLAVAVPAGIWYLGALPGPAYGLILGKSPTIAAVKPLLAGGILVFLAINLTAGIIRPRWNHKLAAFTAMGAALVIMGGFEWTREAARRPYVIYEVMYSNGILKNDVATLNEQGFIRSALWVRPEAAKGGTPLVVGEELFIHQCYACHTIGGVNNDIVKATATMSHRGMVSYLGKMHEIRPFMPPFVGTGEEREALAAFLVQGLHGKPAEAWSPPPDIGRAIFEEHCSSCHQADDIQAAVAGQGINQLLTTLATLDTISDEMQPFSGTVEESGQLAAFLAGEPDQGEAPVVQGGQVFENHCRMCHGLDDLTRKTAAQDRETIFTLLGQLDQLQKAMPPFRGSPAEREALADFLDNLKHGEQR